MLKNIQNLSGEEQQSLVDSVALITVLIAGADDEIDAKELARSGRVTEVRAYSADERLQPFYAEVGKGFASKLEGLMTELPPRHAERAPILEKRLAGLNAIMPKLDPEEAFLLYKDLLTFAGHVAKTSGGVLGYLSVSYAERKLVDLPMIEPVPEPEQ